MRTASSIALFRLCHNYLPKLCGYTCLIRYCRILSTSSANIIVRQLSRASSSSQLINIGTRAFLIFLIRIQTMWVWIACTRQGVTRKRSIKRLKHTLNSFTCNIQIKDVCYFLNQYSRFQKAPFIKTAIYVKVNWGILRQNQRRCTIWLPKLGWGKKTYNQFFLIMHYYLNYLPYLVNN